MSFAVAATAAMFILVGGLLALAWKDPVKGGALYVLLLPLVNLSVTVGGTGRTISYDKLALAGFSALVLLRAVRRVDLFASFWRHGTVRIWVAYLAVTLAAALASPAPWTRQAWGLAEAVVLFFVFLLFLGIGGAPEERRCVVWRAAVLGCAFLFAVLIGQNALFQLTGGWKHTGLSLHRPLYFSDYPGLENQLFDFLPGPIGHPNFLAGYFLLLLPAYAFLFRGSPRQRAAAAGFVLLHLAGIFAIPSRSAGGILGFLGGLLAMGGLWAAGAWRRGGEARARLGGRIALAFAGLCLVVAGVAFGPIRLETGHAMDVRGYIHRSAAEMLLARPFAGYGLDSFPEAFARLEARERLASGMPGWRRGSVGAPISAHSAYLKVFFEQGIPGGLLFLALIAGSLYGAGCRLWRLKLLRRDGFAFWAWGGCVAFAVQAATEELFSFPKTASLYWAMMALALTADAGMREEEAQG